MQLLETAPTMNLTPSEIARGVNELQEYHQIYSPLFERQEQRQWSADYLRGLLLELPRKSIEPIVLKLTGASPNAVRGMQQFLSQGAWSDEAILERHWAEVNSTLGEPGGVLIVDGSDFPKQGCESVGVKRQYCGELGKRANCQAGVFVAYASPKGYTLLDRRLYLPQEWVEDDEYEKRRRRCGVPTDICFKTKLTLACDMVETIVASGLLGCRWLTCDEAFGRDTSFLDSIDDCDLWYFAEVPHNTRVWQQRPAIARPKWSGRGRKPTRERLLDGEPAPQTVIEIAESLSANQWSTQSVKEGSKGPILAEFAAIRVFGVRDELPGVEVWLVLRRHLLTGELKTYLCNAPAHTTKETLVWVSGMRWPIETCFEEGKQYLGMGDYEVRSWRGWHHHMTLCILAHHFVVRLQLKLKKKLLI